MTSDSRTMAIPGVRDVRVSDSTRRDFLLVATGAVAAAGAAGVALPLVGQMNPDASTVAEGGPVDLDIGALVPGQQVVVRWRKKPILVVRRTPEVLAMLRNPQLVERLRDPQSEDSKQPAYAENWHRSINPEYAVVIGICTHLGCIPVFHPQPGPTWFANDWLGGYFCACHGSKYDLAGRVFKKVPAPQNLVVPAYHFVDDKTIRIGENPPAKKPGPSV